MFRKQSEALGIVDFILRAAVGRGFFGEGICILEIFMARRIKMRANHIFVA
ncbi:Hypothetical protein BFF97_01426 [Corynebacterium pseudotuberculosis]|nr:Hypothetical protein BFF97_01426 [Corynebacterium pseudotuberculosis]